MDKRSIVFAALLASLGVAVAGDYDDYIRLLGDNSGNSGESTFVTNIVRSNYGWSDGNDPHSGASYYCGKQLCSPKVASGSYRFAGERLVMAAAFRVLAQDQTLTIDDFVFENGGVIQTAGKTYNTTFQGAMTVKSGTNNPMRFRCGTAAARFVIASAFKGEDSAWCRAEMFSAYEPADRFVQLDNAELYKGTFEVFPNVRLKLFSDMPGTIVVTNGAALEMGAGKTVGSLVLMPGSALDLSAGGTLSLTSLVVSNDVTLIVTTPVTAGAKALVTVPIAGGVLKAEAFTLSRADDALIRLWVEEKAGRQTLYVERLEFDAYTEATGFAAYVSGSSTKNQLDDPAAWSDGLVPHPETNHYCNSQIWIATNAVFNGRSLTIGGRGSIRIADTKSFTAADLRVGSNTGTSTMYFTTAGGSKETYLHGGMTVLSRVTDAWPFAFFGSQNEGQTWVSDQSIHGDADSALAVRGHGNSTPGAVRNYVELRGDLSDFKGTLIVQTNETVKLGSVVFPGTVRLETAYSHLATVADTATIAKVGTIDVRTATSIEVPGINELAVSSVLLATTLTKTGVGVFSASSVGGTDPSIHVQEGRFKALTSEAVRGAALMFAAGTGVEIDYEPSDAGLAAGGVDLRETVVSVSETISVLVQASEQPEGAKAGFVPICTLTTAQAEALVDKINSVRIAFDGKSRRGSLVRRSAGEGVCVLGADVRVRGFCLNLR